MGAVTAVAVWSHKPTDRELLDARLAHGWKPTPSGLKAGDRLLTLDDRWTDSVADCYAAAGYVEAGTEAVVKIKRDGEEKELTVKPQAGL